MITIHHLENSRSQRIVWLAEELKLNYCIQEHHRDQKTGLAPDSLKQVHPLGRAPVVCVDEIALVESAAIIEFLIQRYDHQNLFEVPNDEVSKQQYQFWMHFAEGSLMPAIVAKLVLSKGKQKVGLPFSLVTDKFVDGVCEAYFSPNLTTSLDYVEQHLSDNHGFIGSGLTGVDIQMIFPLESLVATGQAQYYPAINAYVQRIHQRSAYQKALNKTGPYAYASSMSERDEYSSIKVRNALP